MKIIYGARAFLCALFFVAGCDTTPDSFLVRDDNFRDSPWKYVKERLTARPLKTTLFGAPSSVNQGFENEKFSDSMRWMRNGTLESHRYELIERKKRQNKGEDDSTDDDADVGSGYQNGAAGAVIDPATGRYETAPQRPQAYAYGGPGYSAEQPYPGQYYPPPRGGAQDLYTNRYETAPQAMAPQPRGKYDVSSDNPRASPYGMGFEDGCKTYMGAVGAGTWRLLKPRYNMNLMGEKMNVEYVRGFNDAASFCTFRTDWDPH
ncbi:MAG: hypothetical protein ABW189_03325 [Rickettsiales bacterium]